MIILDTSTSVEHEFYAEKKFATDLIEVLPEEQFAVSLFINQRVPKFAIGNFAANLIQFSLTLRKHRLSASTDSSL
ncbi:unnamed protein product [Anisakis simplex]|uniref:VWFA domain-containing protein n=1 Tax=Anisakis simplex TaxID=6269 RepID=A0A0M3JMY0_ANISI|nr:unnamed protein product [Anisakis simplex]